MRRLLFRLTCAVAATAVISVTLAACGGGNDKPPLTPDTVESGAPGDGAAADAGAAQSPPAAK